jgi:catechol 2,3-dioxygenase
MHTAIHENTTLGTVTLAVADAERSVQFYRDLLGFKVLASPTPNSASDQIALGTDDNIPLLILQPVPGARPKPRRATGLYHVAILLPTRRDLGVMLRKLVNAGVRLGASDHLVSEALYLSDPDGNGLEIYRDRPRSEWRWRGDLVEMDTIQLDFEGVLNEPPTEDQALPRGTRIGHVHLQVASTEQAKAFYVDVLGFDVVSHFPGALFVSAGGYHHHLGLNTWHSEGAGPAPADSVGLRLFTVILPDAAALAAVRARLDAAGIAYQDSADGLITHDPFQNALRLQVG